MKTAHVAVAALILKDNKVLLVKHAIRGWEFPGGYVDEGEQIEEAIKRETKEETGIDIDEVCFCGVEHFIEKEHIIFLFSARAKGGELKAGDNLLDVKFFSVEESIKKLTFKHYQTRFKKCLATLCNYFFDEYA